MRRIMTALIDIIFPRATDVARAEKVEKETILSLYSLSYHAPLLTYTALSYRSDIVRSLIRANKFYHSKKSARALAYIADRILFEVISREKSFLEKKPLLIPIPSSRRRRFLRGGNQIEWIVTHLSGESTRLTHPSLHILHRFDRISQIHIPHQQREKNVAGAFFLPKESGVRGENVILLDDVCETGATMRAARSALLKGGAKKVIGIAIAR